MRATAMITPPPVESRASISPPELLDIRNRLLLEFATIREEFRRAFREHVLKSAQ